MIKYEKLYNWQKKAVSKWIQNKFRGIVVASTGTGKTLFLLYCIQKLKVKTFIVVPTEVLMLQWRDEIIKNMDIDEKDIGLYYGKVKDNKQITIGIINSVRDIDLKEYDFLVLDEVNRYASEENIKIAKNNSFKYTLGATATLMRKDERERLLEPLIGYKFYEYRIDQAIKDNVISSFKLVNVGVELSDDERMRYDEINKYILEVFKEFDYDFFKVRKIVSDRDMKDWSIKNKAIKLLKFFNKRRGIYNNSITKIDEVLNLIIKHKNDKIIIFTQSINFADKIADRCSSNNIEFGLFHSKDKDMKTIDDFSKSKKGVLISVMALNEGLNVKDANVGIMVGGFTVQRGKERVLVQRLGRILRKKDNNNPALFYQIYSKDTKESKDALIRSQLLNSLIKRVN